MTREYRRGAPLRWRLAVYVLAHGMRLWGRISGRGIPS